MTSRSKPRSRGASSRHTLINPEALGAPRGYSNGVLAAPGRTLFVAGQIGWDNGDAARGENGRLVSERFFEQFDKALENVVTVVREAGGEPTDLCNLRIYVVDKREYVAELERILRVITDE